MYVPYVWLHWCKSMTCYAHICDPLYELIKVHLLFKSMKVVQSIGFDQTIFSHQICIIHAFSSTTQF